MTGKWRHKRDRIVCARAMHRENDWFPGTLNGEERYEELQRGHQHTHTHTQGEHTGTTTRASRFFILLHLIKGVYRVLTACAKRVSAASFSQEGARREASSVHPPHTNLSISTDQVARNPGGAKSAKPEPNANSSREKRVGDDLAEVVSLAAATTATATVAVTTHAAHSSHSSHAATAAEEHLQ